MVSIEDDFSDPDDLELSLDAAPAAPAVPPAAQAAAKAAQKAQGLSKTPYKQMEPDQYKHYDTLYPIYLDAKVSHKTGGRLVPKSLALEWPLAESMAAACGRVGVQTVFEPGKRHPSDWANPGRVRVLLKQEDGSPHAKFKNKKQLLRAIAPWLAQHQPTSAPGTLPPIHLRYPPHSPAISNGVLDAALSGKGPMGGMGGMLGNMLGGGGGGAAPAAADEEKPAEKKTPSKPKMKKIHQRRR